MEGVTLAIGADPPVGVMLHQMVASAIRIEIVRACGSAHCWVGVIEGFSVIEVAAPDGLSAGWEAAGSVERGDLITEFLPGAVSERPGVGGDTGPSVDQLGGDGRSGDGDAASKAGRNGTEPLQFAGQVVEPGEGAKAEGDLAG